MAKQRHDLGLTSSHGGAATQDPGVLKRVADVARAFHLLAGAICFAALVLVAVRQEVPMSTPQQLTFYGVPAAMMGFFLCAALSAPSLRVKMLLLPVSVGVGLILGELATGLFPGPQQWSGVAEALGHPDTRTKFEVVRDMRSDGIRALPALSPWRLRAFQTTIDGVRVLPVSATPARSTIVACNEGGGWLVYESDAYGFRGGNPEGDTTTIAVVGDSFAFGQCVDQGETVPGRLRRQWPLTRNLGVSGAGPLHELAVLREYGSLFRPAVVVWIYYEGNDLDDLRDEAASPVMWSYMNPLFRVGLPERQLQMDTWVGQTLDSVFEANLAGVEKESEATESVRSVVDGILSVIKLSRLRAAVGFGVHFPEADPLGALQEVIRLGRDTVSDWGGQTILVYLPAYSRYRAMGLGSVAGYEEFLEMAETLRIPVVDLSKVFGAQVDPRALWVHPGGHLNARGYSIAADAIEAEISKILGDT